MPDETILCTADRRRIWAALSEGHMIYIKEDERVIDKETGDDLGCMIAALELQYYGLADWCGSWTMERNPDAR